MQTIACFITNRLYSYGNTFSAKPMFSVKDINLTYSGTGKFEFNSNGPYFTPEISRVFYTDQDKDHNINVSFLAKVQIQNNTFKNHFIQKISNANKTNLVFNFGSENSENRCDNPYNMLQKATVQNFKSIKINVYGGTDRVSFTNVATRTEDGSWPEVIYHNISTDPSTPTVYTFSDSEKFNGVKVVIDGCKMVQNADTTGHEVDFELKNGGIYTYNGDEGSLSGIRNLTIDDGASKIEYTGSLYLTGSLNLIDTGTLRVREIFTADRACGNGILNMDPGSYASFNSIDSACGYTVNYNGTRSVGNGIGGGIIIEVKSPDTVESMMSGGVTTDSSTVSFTYDPDTVSSTWSFGNLQSGDYIYLNGKSGSDTNNGKKLYTPVKTLQKAYEVALELINEHSEEVSYCPIIVFCGPYTLSTEELSVTDEQKALLEEHRVVWTQKDNVNSYSNAISVNTGYEIPTAIVLRDIKLNFIASGKNDIPSIFADGHYLTVDSGVITKSSNDYMPALFGGCPNGVLDTAGSGIKLDVYSGEWNKIYGGNYDGNVIGDITINLGGNNSYPILSNGQNDTTDSFGTYTYAVFGGGQYGSVTGSTTINAVCGEKYYFIFGGGQASTASVSGDTNIIVNNKDVKAARLYGGGYEGNVEGTANISLNKGTVNRVYGAGVLSNTVTNNTNIVIGSEDETAESGSAIVKQFLRGSGDQGAVSGTATLTIKDGALLPSDCSAAAGGYMGGAGKSVLNIQGGTIQCNICAGGYGEYKTGSTTEIDDTKGYVASSELFITGGTVDGDVFAGGNMGYVGTGNHQDEKITTVNITGGNISGNVYGGCNMATTYGNISLTIGSGDKSIAKIFGGGKGTDDVAAEVTGKTTLQVDGNGIKNGIYGGCDYNGSVAATNVTATALPGCNIFGAGYGENTSVKSTTLNLELAGGQTGGNTSICSVYGGGEQGKVSGTTTINAKKWTGNIFGGGKGFAEGANVFTFAKNMFRAVGNAAVSLFSSGATPFAIDGLVDANVADRTTVNVTGAVNGNIYGGGELATVGKEENSKDIVVTHVNINANADVTGNVYGGGQGREGKDYAVIYGATEVNINGGTVTSEDHAEDADTGCVFGGGQIAPVAGNTNVRAAGGIISNIFGGNDVSGNIGGSLNVTLPAGSQAVAAQVYGGGRNAAYTETDEQTDKKANVTISDGKADNVYGGGFGSEAQTTNTNVVISGGIISEAAGREESSGRVFGGGNAAPTENALVTITSGNVSTIFGGGNAATVTKSTEVVVDTADQKCVNTVFAGNNAAAMDIQPKLTFTSGKIGIVYCGGNAGVMTGTEVTDGKLTYAFNYPNIEIDNVYAGCNNTPTNTDTANVSLKLISGKYGTIYGGNNTNGKMEATDVEISRDESNTLSIGTVYGGGNRAASKNTNVTLSSYSDDENLVIYGGGNEATSENASVKLTSGKAKTVYGGGNAATVTECVSITAPATTGGATVTDLYCGNNAADMSIAPTVALDAVTITNFYGGGNEGKMTASELSYSLNSAETKITTVYGGCNQADVTGKVTLNLAGAKVGTAYGGCNTSGTMAESVVNVTGGAGTVFGGGNGRNTVVTTSNVNVNNGTVTGNIYGGSGEGYVETANVNIEEKQEDAQIVVEGNVFGAGYGVTSVAKNTNVKVSLGLDIGTDENTQSQADLWVKEGKSSVDKNDISGATKAEYNWNTGRKATVSMIKKSVFGGGDMGKVGNGDINISKNTAAISEAGNAKVLITNGYIQGNVFGGGNGTPPEGTNYTVYMGTVFGSSKVDVNGGLVEGSIYGCGNQSRTYADNNKAAVVNITEESVPIIIGTSVFGGGNKGEGKNVNASVETVLGDTEVNLTGKDENHPTRIYFISQNKGGVYGDGNLCLVKGKRTVNLKDFNYGNKFSLLKTFYSLQRADVVNMENSRVVLEGAEDLVDASASTELYSINRVGQINMKKNSAVKLTTIVNLLGGLSSDQNTETTYIDKGNNGINNYTHRGGTIPENALTPDQISAYQAAYEAFVKGDTINSTDYSSFNVVCVANGKCLEVKQSDSQYGNVTGLFTLQLLNANPGEGGGFVYANIGEQGAAEGLTKGSTGDFICVTKNGTDESANYMRVVDSVGGFEGTDYTYYYWYIKGGKYSYNVDLNGYIGVSDNDFTEKVNLPVQEGETNKQWVYVLNSVEGTTPVRVENANNAFHLNRLKTDWKPEYNTQDAYAVELKVITYSSTGAISEEKSLGYLAYDENNKWYLNAAYQYRYENGNWTSASATNAKITGTGNSDEANQQTIIDNTLFCYKGNPAQIELQAVLHKGSKVTVEMKDVFNKLVVDLRDGSDFNAVIGKDSQYVINTYTSITRIVPSQDVYMSSGRQYSGVSANSTVKIAQNSAFTVQYVTRYVPNAYPNITEKLTMNITEKYLWSEALGVGFTIEESGNTFKLVSVTSGSKSDYTGKLSKDDKGEYFVNYDVSVTDENSVTTTETRTDILKCQETNRYQSKFPAGTMITLVAKIDDCERTYWYYYCKEAKSEIYLSDFVLMNDSFESPTKKYTFENASNGSVKSSYSNRIIENLTFVVDFAKVDMNNLSGDIIGMIQMKHMYDGEENRDIMDYVTPSEENKTQSQYDRAYPKITDAFTVSQTKNGIETFKMTLDKDKDKYYSKDKVEASITITPDPIYANTKFEEREYSVELKLKDRLGKEIAFPEGTVFTFEGRRLEANANNMSLIVPVKTTGEFLVTIETNIKGFETGTYSLDAELYSSNVSDYHNSINAQKLKDGEAPKFTVISNPVYAISIEDEATGDGTNKIFDPGETISLKVSTTKTKVDDTIPVVVNLYSYDKSSKSYQLITMNELFESQGMSDGGIWKGKMKSDAQNKTYRLEFAYGDKTEYEDFIVKNSQN